MSSAQKAGTCFSCNARLLGKFCSVCGAHAPAPVAGQPSFFTSMETPPPSPPPTPYTAQSSYRTLPSRVQPETPPPPPPPSDSSAPSSPLPLLPRSLHTSSSDLLALTQNKTIPFDSPPLPPPPSKLAVTSFSSLPPSANATSRPPALPSAATIAATAVSSSSSSAPKFAWKAKKDPKTGRNFYFNSITGLSTWKMPVELLKQVKADDKAKLQSLSAPELARWTRISLPPPPLHFDDDDDEKNRLPPTPLQIEETNVVDISILRQLALTEETRLPHTRARVVSNESNSNTNNNNNNLPKQSPRPPRKIAPRRSPSQPVQLETHRFFPDPESPPSTPKAPDKLAPVINRLSSSSSSSSSSLSNNERSIFFSTPQSKSVSPLSLEKSSFLEAKTVPPPPPPSPPQTSALPPSPPLPQIQAQAALPNGWLVLKDQNNREYHFKPATGEVVWTQLSEQEDNSVVPPPPPEEEEEEVAVRGGGRGLQQQQHTSVHSPPPSPGSQNTSKKFNSKISTTTTTKAYSSSPFSSSPFPASSSSSLSVYTKPKAHSFSRTETPTTPTVVIPRTIPKEMNQFIEEIMRPKYGQGQLLKDPELLKSFFVYLINIPENLRHVVFHEFFLGIFWRDEILEQLLNFGSWKQWLLILIAEATVSHHEILEYVLMTLIEMFHYFFHKFSPQHNGIRQVHGNTHLLLEFGSSSGGGNSRSMTDFLNDALHEIDKESDKIVSFKALSGLNLRICAWDRKPPWARPEFNAVEWPNLVASIAGQEDYLFFPLPNKEFRMPKGGTDFLGLPVIESIVVVFEKLKVNQLTECEERTPELIQLQKYYSAKTVHDYEFFKALRDFFRFYGHSDCMELQKTGLHLKSKVPPHCSASEIVQFFLSRKRPYGSKVQKKVACYLSQVSDHYRRVFSEDVSKRTSVDGGSSISPSSQKGTTTWI